MYSMIFPDIQNQQLRRLGAVLVGALLFTGFALSIISWLDLCTTACVKGHDYRLFGLRFESVGTIYFAAMGGLWMLIQQRPQYLFAFKVLIACGLGAELRFLMAQRTLVGGWCPICFAIFACVAILALIFATDYIWRLRQMLETVAGRKIMKQLWQGIGSLTIVMIGFIIALVGVAKATPSFAEGIGHEPLYFGNRESPVDIYIFTDWFCPACREVEPLIQKQFPSWTQKARVFFIDTVIHQDSMNFVPYNLAFMLKNKNQYIQLRQKLQALALRDTTPSEEQVEQAAKSLGVVYSPLDYSDINQGVKYFQQVSAKYKIGATPIVVIVNPSTKKMKKLSGVKEISQANVPAIVDKLSQ